MKFVIISAVLLVCGVSGSPFLFNQWNQQQPAPYQQSAPVQYYQQPAVQYAQPTVQYRQTAPVQYVQPAVQYRQVAPVQQIVPVQYYYRNWQDVQQVEPTIIIIRRSRPDAHNISVNAQSNSSSVANANNNNSITINNSPPAPAPPVQSGPVSLQTVVVVSNPSAKPEAGWPVKSKNSDESVVTNADEADEPATEATTIAAAPTSTSTASPTSTTQEPSTTAEASTTPVSNSAEPMIQDESASSASAPQALSSGIPNVPITLQSFVVVGGQQQPARPSVIAIQDEANTLAQSTDPNGAQTASTVLPTSLPSTDAPNSESTTPSSYEMSTQEPEFYIPQVPLAALPTTNLILPETTAQ